VIIVEEVEQRSREDVCEEEANAQAGAWILPRPLSFPRDRINQAWIARIAQERSLAPIVVIGHLQNMGRLEWRTPSPGMPQMLPRNLKAGYGRAAASPGPRIATPG
jgi:hypothetical protein